MEKPNIKYSKKTSTSFQKWSKYIKYQKGKIYQKTVNEKQEN